ncbi:type II toxin-antitoxin system VapC family toxin [Thermodesulfobacteriota bacterium]
MYMLDTNICIYILKKRPTAILDKFDKVRKNQICISIITYAELKFGVEKSLSKRMNQEILKEFVARLQIRLWDEEAADDYAIIRHHLEKRGTPIGNMDLMIASHARSCGYKLVTNNLKEFNRVPKLKLENWVFDPV